MFTRSDMSGINCVPCDCSIYGKLSNEFPNVWNGSVKLQPSFEQETARKKYAKKFKVKSKI
jgi:hypothetical protein